MLQDSLDTLIACPECDLVIERIELHDHQQARCPRCQSLLYQGRRDPILKTLIVSISGLIFVFPAYFLPTMTMQSVGLSNSMTLISSIPDMLTPTLWLAGMSVFLFTILYPVLVLLSAFWISLNLLFNQCPKHLPELQKFYQRMVRWVMPEVYLLGAIVSYVKLLDNFQVFLGPGIICFTMLMFCTILVTTTVSNQHVWDRIKRIQRQDG